MASALPKNVGNWKDKLDLKLKEKNVFTDILAKIETKTGVRRLYITLGLAIFIVLYLMVGYGAHFLCNVVGFMYPAYASVKAVESPRKEDDTQWLMYWTVYSFFSLLEFFTEIFLFWIPFYPLLKCIFLIWCMCPAHWNGSQMIFQLCKSLILKHQNQIDEALYKVAENFKDGMYHIAHSIKDLSTGTGSLVALELLKKRTHSKDI